MLSKACLSLHLVRVALAVFDTIVEGKKKPENGYNCSRGLGGKV